MKESVQNNKAKFEFTIQNTALAQNAINQWLQLNNFTPVDNMMGANYFHHFDPMLTGEKGFEYYIYNNQVTIFAFLGKLEKKTMPCDNSLVGAMGKQPYRNILKALISELENLEKMQPQMQGYGNQLQQQPVQQPVQPMYQNNQAYAVPAQQTYNTQQNFNQPQQNFAQQPQMQQFAQQPTIDMNASLKKSKNKFAIISFVLGLASIILPFLGAAVGLIFEVIGIILGVQGTKSEKKGLSIAGIVLNSIGLVLTLGLLILTIFLA